MSRNYWKYAKYANFGLSLGITMVISIFLGFYIGSKLDKKFGTDPWLLLLGILLGTALAFYSMLKELQALEIMDRKTNKKQEKE